ICLHYESHNNYPQHEVHDQLTISAETNVINILHFGKAMVFKSEILGKLVQMYKDRTRCHLCSWIQKPILVKNEPKFMLARHCLNEKKQIWRNHHKKHKRTMKTAWRLQKTNVGLGK
ncbi:hypothetical protein J0S82_004455, partial [Galemys pyrenaicus]